MSYVLWRMARCLVFHAKLRRRAGPAHMVQHAAVKLQVPSQLLLDFTYQFQIPGVAPTQLTPARVPKAALSDT